MYKKHVIYHVLVLLGAPIVMSLPHFLYCDPKEVIDLVIGLTPNKEEHQTFFDVEPVSTKNMKLRSSY